MPAFLSFFSKRDSSAVLRKSPRSSSQPSPSTPTSPPPASSTKSIPSPSIADASEQLESSELSLEAEYVLADAELSPVNSNVIYYPLASNSASTSATKLKMPFRRRQQSASNKLTTIPSHPPAVPPKDPYKHSVESSVSDPPSLLPPPSRSAIFGSYADPHNALSTRSLPQGVPAIHPPRSSRDVPQYFETMSNPDSHTSFPAPQSKQPSKGGLFSWARPRARTKSKPSLPESSLSSAPVLTLPTPDSFNLKAFRHVTSPASESPPPGSPSENDPLPRPRPRGGSHASDSSQRISVAAFREAQAARRSATNSPVPSVSGDRDNSTPGQVRNRRRSALATPPTITKVDPQPRSPLPSSPPMRSPPSRSSTAPLSFASLSMTSSESSEEEESESEAEATLRPRRRRTITSRSAQSEAGFRSSPILSYGAARSDNGHGLSSGLPTRPSPSPRNNVNYSPNPEASGSRSRSSSVYSRARGSLSTPALVPEVATKRAPAVPRYPAAVPRPTHPPPRSRSRASTSSESSSESCSSEDAPLALLQRPGSALSRTSGPSRRPTKPLVDIGQLVGENSVIPPRALEPSTSSQLAAETGPPAVRYRKTSVGLGERLSAIASGLGGLQPARSKSPDSTYESRDEAFTPPEMPEKPRSESPIPSPLIMKPASSALKSKTNKSSSAMHSKSFSAPKLDTLSLKPDSGISPPSSSTSSDAPIPHITPTPIRERQEPPSFAVTSRPISHASNPSTGTLAALDKAIADMDMDSKPGPRRSVPAMTEQPKEDQQQQRRQPQEDSQTTVRVVRSVPLKSPRDESLPVPPPRSRARPPAVGVTVSNVHLTPPSALRQASSSAVVPPRKPFALRDSSPASSAGDSSSSRMPITPRDGSELGSGPAGRPAIGHRKRVSVTFVDEVEGEKERREKERESRRPSVGKRPGHGRGPPPVVSSSSDDEDTSRDRERAAEEKRRERRRSEAKAAIELGNVINGTGPIDDDDDDDDDGRQPMNVPPRMSMAMGMGTGMNTGNNNIPFPSGVGSAGLQGQWGAGASAFGGQLNNLQMQNFLNAGAGSGLAGSMDASAGMNMGMGMVDPRVFAVHQQAMMIAKQTYQLAVAQQAMRDAADEWERGSAISGWTGGRSSASTPNILNMGMGMNMNMGGGGGGMGGYPGGAGSFAMSGAGGMWPGGAVQGFPGNSARPMYSGNYAASEIGGGGGHRGGGGGGGWATSSVYGESFGAPRDRPSRAPRQSTLVQMSSSPLNSGSGSGGSAVAVKGGRPRTRTAPSSGGSAGGQRPGPGAASNAGGSGPVQVKKRDGPPSGGYGLVGTVSPPSSWKGPP